MAASTWGVSLTVINWKFGTPQPSSLPWFLPGSLDHKSVSAWYTVGDQQPWEIGRHSYQKTRTIMTGKFLHQGVMSWRISPFVFSILQWIIYLTIKLWMSVFYDSCDQGAGKFLAPTMEVNFNIFATIIKQTRKVLLKKQTMKKGWGKEISIWN